MRIDIFHHFELDSSIDHKLDKILQGLKDIQKTEEKEMKEFDDLVAVVNSEKTVVDGLSTAVDTIVADITVLLNKIADAPTPEAVQALTAEAQEYINSISAGKDQLVAAVQNVTVTVKR